MSTVRVHSLTALIPASSAVRVHSLGATADGASRVRVHSLGATATNDLVANAGADQTVDGLAHFVLDGSASTGEITAWEWTQDPADAYQVTLTGADARYASADAPGPEGAAADLHFHLRVSDGTTWSDVADTTVTVARHRTFRLISGGDWEAIVSVRLPARTTHRPPTAVIGPDQTATVGQAVTIGGDDVAPDGIILGREFAWLSGPARPALEGSGGLRQFTPLAAGDYVWSKKVWDDFGTPSPLATCTVTAVPVDPGFALGTTMPDTGLVGFRVPETQLANYAGSLTNLKAGDVVERLAITGNVEPFASGATIRDSLILMGQSPYPAGTTYPGLRALHSGVSNTLLEWCTIRPNVRTVDTYGLQGGGFTARRCDVSGAVDGASISGLLATGEPMFVRLEGCWIHDLVQWPVDPRQGNGPSHGDGIQSAGLLSALEVVGCRIDGSNTSAILLQQNAGTYGRVLLDRNWINGYLAGGVHGGAALNITENGRGPIANLTITGNRFGGWTYSRIPATTYNAPTTTIFGNVDASGNPMTFVVY